MKHFLVIIIGLIFPLQPTYKNIFRAKEKVKRDKLRNPDKAKYYIHDAIKSVLPNCKTPADLLFGLKEFEIKVDYKFNRKTKATEGMSCRHGNISFKGSQVDRKYSFRKLKKEFEKK